MDFNENSCTNENGVFRGLFQKNLQLVTLVLSLVALARAFHWQDMIDGDRYSSITEIAHALDVDRSYVGRITRLTLLTPDIVEAILRGVEPSGLSLGRLTRQIPVEWQEQRRKPGFEM